MDRAILNAWTNLIEPVFPEHADLWPEPRSGHYYILIDWELGTDADVPIKHRSKKIHLIITSEFADQYCQLDDSARSAADEKLKAFAKQRYEHFDPTYDIQPFEDVPFEEWTVTPELLSS